MDNTREIMHFGVKGMRWGVRRKQDDSGSSGGPRGLKKLAPNVFWTKEERAAQREANAQNLQKVKGAVGNAANSARKLAPNVFWTKEERAAQREANAQNVQKAKDAIKSRFEKARAAIKEQQAKQDAKDQAEVNNRKQDAQADIDYDVAFEKARAAKKGKPFNEDAYRKEVERDYADVMSLNVKSIRKERAELGMQIATLALITVGTIAVNAYVQNAINNYEPKRKIKPKIGLPSQVPIDLKFNPLTGKFQ